MKHVVFTPKLQLSHKNMTGDGLHWTLPKGMVDIILYFYGNTLCLLFLSKCVYRQSYRCQTFNPLPLQSKTLPWVVCVWLISLFFMILFTVILIMIIIIIIMLVINIFIVMTLNLPYLLHKPDSLTSNIYTLSARKQLLFIPTLIP